MILIKKTKKTSALKTNKVKMKTFNLIASRFVFITPFLAFIYYFEYKPNYLHLFQDDSALFHILKLLLGIMIGLVASEFILNKLVKLISGPSQLTKSIWISSIYFVTLACAFMISVFLNIRTPYSRWVSGISRAERLLNSVTPVELQDTERRLETSLKIAKDLKISELERYSNAKKDAFKELSKLVKDPKKNPSQTRESSKN